MNEFKHYDGDLLVKSVTDRVRMVAFPYQRYSKVVDKHILVPRGFHTDFASVPRLPLVFMLLGGRADRASVIHDYLYSTQTFDRKTSDRIFLEHMGEDGINIIYRYLMYWGVRAGGFFAWRRHTRRLGRV